MSDSIYTGDVLRLAFGGEGVIHHEELVVFIPFTAPGDHISYRIIKRKKNFAQGKLIDILKPSPERTTPKCPYFGTCGGCQLQHLNYQSQLEYKRLSIQDALIRQGKLNNISVPSVIPATQQWSYRRRISLTLKPLKDNYTAGYIAADGLTLLSIDQCPIFVEKDSTIFSQVQEVVRSLIKKDSNDGKLTILKRNNNTFLLHFHFKNLPNNAEQVLANAAKKYSNWTGIIASSTYRTIEFGQLETHLEIADLKFDFSPKAFIQNHPEQSLNIYHSLCKHAAELQPKKILDLYCGIGISSLMLARQGFTVCGVETNKEAIRLAQNNTNKNQINHARFIQADVQNVLYPLLDEINPDLVIVNPPREGVDPKVIEALLQYLPMNILYISCMPPTLARDLNLLCKEKYKVDSVEAYDMFPQTSHVETLVKLMVSP